MWKVMGLMLVIACEPPKTAQETTAIAGPETQHTDSCRDDIPDCAAVCALRETHRNEFIDFYERRCATVILGKNPDRVEPRIIAATATASTSSSGSVAPEFPPDVRASLMTTRTPFDPVSVTRTGGSEPPECKAARILRAQKRDREADMMDAMCTAKGGDAGT